MTSPKYPSTTLQVWVNELSCIETSSLSAGYLDDFATTNARIAGPMQEATAKTIDQQNYVLKQLTK
jgi:hypothetical protein